MSLEDNIKKWVEYDSLIKAHNEKIRQLRSQRHNTEEQILNSIKEQEKKPIINISDGVLKFSTISVQQPLSYRLIENSLKKIIKNEHQTVLIMNTIRENRTSKEYDAIKRYYR